MTNEEWEYYINKCNVPQHYRPIVKKYRKNFGQHITEIGKIPGIEFEVEIERIADSKNGQWKNPHAFHTNPYSQNASDQAEIERQLDEQLEAGIIKPSTNPGEYQASCTVVTKKADPITGEKAKRVAIDYTGLNANTKMKNYPIPNIRRIVEKSTLFKKYILIDIKSAYNHIPVKEECQELLGFAVENRGRFIPTRMNFGPKGAPAVFGAAMQMIFGDLYRTGWFYQYFDDLTICGNTTKELMERFEIVMQKIEQYNLTIKLTKCEWEKEEINILGSRISKGSQKIQPKYLEAVKQWKLTSENAESFLGMINYLSKFIPNLAELTKPIREIVERPKEKKGGLKPPKRSVNDPEVIRNFEKIRQIILNDPELKGIDPNKPVTIRTDASDIAGGAVLMQEENKILKPRAYFSTTFNETERKWHILRKEALVLRKAVQHFKKDIKCLRPGWITIQTDNQTLKNMLKKPQQHDDTEIQYAAYEVAQIFANVEHIKGSENFIADFLSQKRKTIQPSNEERLLVGIMDNPDYIV